MTSALASLLGLAKQTAKGTPNTTDAAFKYLLFNQGGVSPNNIVLPLDAEVGGGAMLRDVKKVGVTSGGAVELIFRPSTLGLFLLGAFGKVTTTTPEGATNARQHVFELDADQFAAPYFTVRSAPGAMWGEQYQDVRINALSMEFRGANFVRGAVGMVGGLPAKLATTNWAASDKVDDGPQFLTPLGDIELPAGTDITVLSGSFTAGMAIPLDEQWVIGSYSPHAMDIVSRAFAVTFLIKIADGTLYSKMAYDPAGGSDWVASLLREANFKMEFKSDIMVEGSTPYSLKIEGNGQSGADANVVWSTSPIASRAGGQVIMSATGIFLASPTSAAPIKATLINSDTAY